MHVVKRSRVWLGNSRPDFMFHIHNQCEHFEACLAVCSQSPLSQRRMHFALYKAVLIIAFLVGNRYSKMGPPSTWRFLFLVQRLRVLRYNLPQPELNGYVEVCVCSFPFLVLFPYFIPAAALARGAGNNLTFSW